VDDQNGGDRSGMKILKILVGLALVAAVSPVSARAALSGCPDTIDDATFASADQLRAWNQVESDFGPRPTASPAQEGFVDWLEARMREIPGLDVSSLNDAIDRWLETGSSLTANGETLATSGAVPYSLPADVTAPVAYVPPGTALSDADVTGKIVVRDVALGSIPLAVFFAVAYYVHDPGLTFDWTSNYARDWISYASRVQDLRDAADAGAAGIVFVHGFPREQMLGHYDPYEGVFWKVPAVYLGVDEGQRLKDAVAAGPVTAALSVQADVTAAVPTRTLVSTLPGASPERIVIQSHTDGMNAVWDNGPIGILALAKWFAAQPLSCRPRTIQFVFTTAHLYQSHAGASRYAQMLDDEYDGGTVDFVEALEHLGAMEYLPDPRVDRPGDELRPTGRTELFATFVNESPALLQALASSVVRRDLRRTFILRGADAPQVGFPPHRSYGGEGGPYRVHIIPTVAGITGPSTLFDPAFHMEQIDFDLMRRQTLAFGDVVLQVDDLPREVIAGADTLYRAGRG
jgi:hypothetical protein